MVPSVSSSNNTFAELACVVIAAAVVGTGRPPIPRQGELEDFHGPRDRQLNRAIHIIALGRVAWDPRTRAYIQASNCCS
jgi:hypothetical protein